MNSILNLFGSLSMFAILLLIASTILTIIATGEMAGKRGRSIVGWILIALICTPYVAIICLFCLGESVQKRIERVAQDEKIKLMLLERHNTTEPLPNNSLVAKIINGLYATKH